MIGDGNRGGARVSVADRWPVVYACWKIGRPPQLALIAVVFGVLAVLTAVAFAIEVIALLRTDWLTSPRDFRLINTTATAPRTRSRTNSTATAGSMSVQSHPSSTIVRPALTPYVIGLNRLTV